MNFSWPQRAAGKAARRSAARVWIVGITAVGAAALAVPAISAVAATSAPHTNASAKHAASTAKHAAPAARHAAATAGHVTAVKKHATVTTMSNVSGYVGSKFTLAAKVRGWTPKGWVEFLYNHKALCSGALSGGNAHCTHVFGAVGSFRVEALYEGNGTHKPSSAVATIHVLALPPKATTTAVTATPAAAYPGEAVTLSAAVTSKTAATGHVTFTDGAGTLCTATLAAGTASCPYTWEAAGGPYTVTGTYSGDTTHLGSEGTATVTVAVLPTTTTITNPNFTTEPAGTNQTVNVQVVDNTAGGPAPTGTVAVTSPADLNPGLMDPGAYGCNATLTPGADGVSTGTCTIVVGANAYGFIETLATYPATAEFGGSSTAGVEHKFINLMPTETTVVLPGSATAGVVDLSADVIPLPPIPAENILAANSETLPDLVSFTITPTTPGGTTGAGCTDVALVAANPNYVDCDPTLVAGTYTITATFSGDEYAATSTSTEATLVVS